MSFDFDKFKEYVNSYKPNKDFEDKTFQEDMVYGIGIATDGEFYQWAGGYDRFKQLLIDRWEKP